MGEGFATRFDEMSTQEAQGRQEFLTRLDQSKALLQGDISTMDKGLANRLGAMNESFDQNGRLIQNSIDKNGNVLKRSIDESGNLILNTYSKLNGQMLDSQALSINRLMKEVGNNRIVQGSNANMGGMSPTAGATAPQPVYSGLESPYAQTIA
jgi:hypothetical protein